MAVKKPWRWPRHADEDGEGRRDPEGMAARLAPLEETPAFGDSEQKDAGKLAKDTIRIDRTSVKVPEYLGEGERDMEGTFRLAAPVVFIIVVFGVFIAFIAWQISLMPDK